MLLSKVEGTFAGCLEKRWMPQSWRNSMPRSARRVVRDAAVSRSGCLSIGSLQLTAGDNRQPSHSHWAEPEGCTDRYHAE